MASSDYGEEESFLGFHVPWPGCGRVLLWVVAVGVFILTIMSLIAGFDTLSSNSFFIYSKFAWEQWFPSFFVIMVMLMMLSLLSMLMVCFAALISWKETRPLVRAFYISSATLGVIMLLLALFCWIYNDKAKPYVIRAGNLLCQDPKVWHCAASARRLDENATMAQRLDQFFEDEEFEEGADGVQGFGPRLRVQGRRLNPAAASLAFVKSLNSDVDERTREPKGCEVIKEVCKQPTGFNWQTACVCSGNWDYAPVAPTTTTPAVPAGPIPGAATASVITPAPDVTESSQLEVETTSQATTTPEVAAASVTKAQAVKATTKAPPAPEPPKPEPPTTTPNPALEKVLPADAVLQKNSHRRLQTAPADSKREDIGPWYGSLGAFCGEWGDDKYVSGEWCFVLPTQLCAPNSRSPFVSTQGYPMIRSTAPCSSEVESRSEIILEGYEAMAHPLLMTALLGGALCALAGAGKVLQLCPTPEAAVSYEAMPYSPVMARDRAVVDYAPQASAAAAAPKPRNDFSMQKFQEAQAKAMEKLTKDTPYNLRLMLYGYYNQAINGDVQGERPTYFEQKDRAKYDAWAKCKGMDYDSAVAKYCEVVNMI